MDLIISFKKYYQELRFIKKIIDLEFSKFILVGVFNTFINYGVFIVLFLEFDLVYYIAGAIGFLCGSVSGFFLNRLWTFKSNIPIKSGYLKYFIIQLICLGVHSSTQITVTELLHFPEIYSQLGGIVITTFMNFFPIRRIVFIK